MNHRHLPAILLICVIAATFGGCATIDKIVQKPEITFKGMSLKDASLFQATPVFSFNIYNPNAIAIPLRGLSYNLKINGRHLAEGIVTPASTLHASSSSIAKLPVTVNYLDMFDTISSFLRSDKVDYELAGGLDLGLLTIPLSAKGVMSVPKLPEIRLQRVAVTKMGLAGASLVFDVGIRNPNNFTMGIDGLNYELTLGDSKITKGSTGPVETIGKNNKSTLQIPIDVDFLSIGRAISQLLSRKTMDYQMTGNMSFDVPAFGVKHFPFSKTGNMPVVR
ncbi:MAG: hypothetical protein HKM93_16440 [Desulfobacteraceae bacterium]|nr:hypothetical protein [Desulfobacteraceae bacterium]